MVVADSAVHFEQALAHAQKRRVQDFNVMQAVGSVRVTAHHCLDVCGSTLLLPRLMP